METKVATPSRPKRRTWFEIYLDILDAIEQARLKDGSPKPTRVQYQVNLPYDKFSKYLRELRKMGLLKLKDLTLTAKGQVFRTESRRFFQILEDRHPLPAPRLQSIPEAQIA